MKRARLSEDQIVGSLKPTEVTGKIREVRRPHSVTEQAFYHWRRNYGDTAQRNAVVGR